MSYLAPMGRVVHVTTIQLVLPQDDATKATDALSAWLTQAQNAGEVLDWQYLKLGGQHLTPTARTVPDMYTEGDAFASGPPR